MGTRIPWRPPAYTLLELGNAGGAVQSPTPTPYPLTAEADGGIHAAREDADLSAKHRFRSTRMERNAIGSPCRSVDAARRANPSTKAHGDAGHSPTRIIRR